MVELTADRLVLVDDGTAADYPGSIEDYIDFVLGRNQPKADAPAEGATRRTARPRPRARARRRARRARK